jgi:hypothetical protein
MFIKNIVLSSLYWSIQDHIHRRAIGWFPQGKFLGTGQNGPVQGSELQPDGHHCPWF